MSKILLLYITSNINTCSFLGQWSSPIITGHYSPPGCHYVLEQINNTTAILFGGLFNDCIVTNTIYILDVSINNTVVS